MAGAKPTALHVASTIVRVGRLGQQEPDGHRDPEQGYCPKRYILRGPAVPVYLR